MKVSIDTTKLPPGYEPFFEMLGAVHERNEPEDMIRRTYGVQVKGIDRETRSVRVIASSEAVDSYDEIVEQDWDLKRYKANPVVLYGHNRSGGMFGRAKPEETLPIGSASDVGIVDGKLEATLRFVNKKAVPLAENVWQGFLQDSLRAVSVGFRSNDIREEKRDGDEVFVLSQNELFEISVVPMGANPEAVAKSTDGVSAMHAQLRRLAAKQISPAASGPETEGPAMTVKTIEQPAVETETPAPAAVEAEKTIETPPEPVIETKAAPEVAPDPDPDPEVTLDVEPEEERTTDDDELDAEDLRDELAVRTLELSEALTELEQAVDVRAELEQTVKDVTEQRDALDNTLIKLDVAEYLGVKFVPAELEAIAVDRKRLGHEAFVARMTERPDLALTKDVTGAGEKLTNQTSAGANGAASVVSKTLAEAKKSAAALTTGADR